jgi:hypothetical protein
VRLGDVHIPDETGAEERAWRVVRSAYERRTPLPPTRRAPVRVLAVAVVIAAVAAAAATPSGRAVLGSVRDAIGKAHAAAALTRLPGGGRLIVNSSNGPWLVSSDGSKRLLADYVDAAWSPHGLFIVATQPNTLAALEPGGEVRWSLARPRVRFPRWGGSLTDTRIAYLSGSRLHVVAGDGTGDRDACGEPAAAAVAPAWRPGKQHVLGLVDTRGRISVLETDTCALRWRSAPIANVRALAWSSDGARLLAVSRIGLTLFGERSARPLATRSLSGIVGAAFQPKTHTLGVVRGRDVLLLDANRLREPVRHLFGSAGGLTGIAWSPDGRWLLIAWARADQWLFVPADGHGRVHAVASIDAQFGGGPFPRLGGWCCAS